MKNIAVPATHQTSSRYGNILFLLDPAYFFLARMVLFLKSNTIKLVPAGSL